jgi:hypothetical protein
VLIASLGLAVLFIAATAWLLPRVDAGKIRPTEADVVIIGDAGLDSSPYVSGRGTPVEPYFMTGVVASRIAIYNTTKPLTMSYCTVHGSPSTSGIILENCAGLMILHYPSVDNSYQGIYAENSSVSVNWGTVRHCTMHAVVLIGCAEPEVRSLAIKNASRGGICIYDCYHPDIQGVDAEVPSGAQYFAYIGPGTQDALICNNLIITTITTPFEDHGTGTFLYANTVTATRPPPAPPGGGGDDDPPGGGEEPPAVTIDWGDIMPLLIVVLVVVVLLGIIAVPNQKKALAFVARMRQRAPPPPPPEPPFVVVGGEKRYFDGENLVLAAAVISPAVVRDATDIQGLDAHKIKRLDLSGNHLRSIDFAASMQALEELVVDDNGIERIGPGFPGSLRRLAANGNRIGEVKLGYGCQLERLELRGNALRALDGLAFGTNLQLLRISDNEIDRGLLERLGGIDDDGFVIDMDALQRYFRDPDFKRAVSRPREEGAVHEATKAPEPEPVDTSLAKRVPKPAMPERPPAPAEPRQALTLEALLRLCTDRYQIGARAISRQRVLEKLEDKAGILGKLVSFLESARLVRLDRQGIALSDSFGYPAFWSRIHDLHFDEGGLKDVLEILRDVEKSDRMKYLDSMFPPDR